MSSNMYILIISLLESYVTHDIYDDNSQLPTKIYLVFNLFNLIFKCIRDLIIYCFQLSREFIP